MEVTEVLIKIVESKNRLLAFAQVTFDNCFTIKDLKIVDGEKGKFVSMPSRKIVKHCPRCSNKNMLEAKFCNACGTRLAKRVETGERKQLYADVAHPIKARFRTSLQHSIIEAYKRELILSRDPNYVCKFDKYS